MGKSETLLCRCTFCTYTSRRSPDRIGTRLLSDAAESLPIRLRHSSKTLKRNTGFEKMLDREKIRQKFIANRLNKKAPTFV